MIENLDSVLESGDLAQEGYRFLRVNWDKIQENLDPFTWNVNLLEVLVGEKVCHREFVVIGKDLTAGEIRVELIA